MLVLGDLLELVNFLVVLLNVGRQAFEKSGLGVEQSRTALVGAVDFFEILDLVDHVMVQAGLAEAVLVVAVSHEDLLVFFLVESDLSLANFATADVLQFMKGAQESAAHNIPEPRLGEFLLRAGFSLSRFDHLLPEHTLQHHGHPKFVLIGGERQRRICLMLMFFFLRFPTIDLIFIFLVKGEAVGPFDFMFHY
jgi:hypothetical protein